MALRADFPTHLDDVLVYLRKSREDREAEERARREGREEIETLSRHRRTLLELAHKHHHNISVIYEEVVSGEFISERPEMLRLLDAVENGEVSAVWVMDLDRLGRGDMADQGTILRAFKDSETLILTPDKMYDLNDEMDEEITEFKTFIARRELKLITKRMQRGRIASVMEGKFIGTRPPFGYDVNRDLILIPNDDAPVVKQIFDLYANRDMGCNRIAQYLNSMGIKTPMGKQWRGESVLAILKNPVYVGQIVWKKVKADKRKGTFRQRPEHERVKAKGKHEPLVDEVTYERTVQIRQLRSHVPVQSHKQVSSALSGLVQCSKCGEMLVKRPYTKQAAHLICKNPNCTQKSTRLSLVEDKLIEALAMWLENYRLSIDEVSAAMAPKNVDTSVNEKLISNVDSEIERITKQRDNLHDLLEQGIYDTQTYLERNQKLLQELSVLRERRSFVESEIQKTKDIQKAHVEIVPRITNVLSAYRATDDVPERNRLLKSILEKAVYNKEKWQQGDQFDLTLYPLV